jgi:sulfite reductase (NADPH) hemoprotein beta-component
VAARVAAGDVRGPGIQPTLRTSAHVRDEDVAHWRATNVRPQKQAGFVTAIATVPLGDLTGAQFRVIADLSHAFSDGTVRVTPTQDLLFRWVPIDRVRDLYDRLAAAGLGLADADTIADVTSCPGAESCKLAVTQSRGLGQLLEQHVRANPDLIPIAPTLDVKISGCPNGCGQHHIAAVGFQGSLRKLGEQAVPQYFVMIGGGVEHDRASFGRLVAKVPARRSPVALERLARLFAAEREGSETATAFFQRVELARVKALLADLETLAPETARPDDFIDLAETKAFTPEMQDGECAV